MTQWVLLVLFSGGLSAPPPHDSGAPSSAEASDAGSQLPSITPGPNVTLAEALKAADERNLTLAAVRVEIDKAHARLKMARAALLPMVGGQVGYTHNDHADKVDIAGELIAVVQQSLPLPLNLPATEPMVIRREDEVRGVVQASMPLVNLQAWVGVDAAKLDVEAAELAVVNGREQLLFAVAQAFWWAHISRELVEVQASQLKSATHHLAVARARIAAGDAMRIDEVRAETEVEKAAQDLLAAHLALDNARDALASLMQLKELPLPVTPPALAPVRALADREITEALEQRPDIKAARTTARLADRLVDGSWMQFLPTLSLSGQYGYLFTEPADLGSSDRSRWAALLTLSVPIYNELRYADLDAKRAMRRQAELREAELLANAQLDVRKAYRDYLSSLSVLETAERQADLAREAMALTDSAYANGAGTSLDVTDAQRTERTAEINVATQRLRSQLALLVWMRVTGQRAETLMEAR